MTPDVPVPWQDLDDLHDLPGLRQLLPSRIVLNGHRHFAPYAALLIAGSHGEAGGQGRRLLFPDDRVLHETFSAHGNRVGLQGARLVKLRVADGARLREQLSTDDRAAAPRSRLHDAAPTLLHQHSESLAAMDAATAQSALP